MDYIIGGFILAILWGLSKSGEYHMQRESLRWTAIAIVSWWGSSFRVNAEISLRLPIGTMRLDRCKDWSEETVSLIHLTFNIPWILEVADSGFDEKVSKRVHQEVRNGTYNFSRLAPYKNYRSKQGS